MHDIKIPEKPKSLIPIISPNINIKSSDYTWNSLISKLSTLISAPIEEPKNNVNADVAFATFSLSKKLKKSPQNIANDAISQFEKIKSQFPLINSSTEENGYVNFCLNFDIFGEKVLQEVEKYHEEYGNQNIGNNQTVVIDCSSPNIAKFMSIGHLRSTVIGESLSRIYRSLGYTTIRDNHLGDWGTQFGMLGAAYEKWGSGIPQLKSKNDRDVVDGLYQLYVKMHQEIEKEKETSSEKESELEKIGKLWFKKLEEGDSKARELWKWSLDLSLREFHKIYELLGVKFEYMIGESFYIPMLPNIYDVLEKSGVGIRDNTGALIVKFDLEGKDRMIFQKTDGTSIYQTRDLAAIAARIVWFNPLKILYVVGGEQQNHFRQVFETFKMLYKNGKLPELEHVYFGMLSLPEGKMSTRKGNVVFLEDFLQKAIDKAKIKVRENNTDMNEAEIDELARKIGIAAVVYFDLGQGRTRDIKFDWDKALSFEGTGSPYIQYAYTRAFSVLKKAENEKIKVDKSKLEVNSFEEKELIKQIAKFPQIIKKAANLNQPSIIGAYAYDIASLFNQFYKNNRIINAETDLQKSSRLRLTNAAAITIKKALYLLGIDVPERM